MRNATIVGRTFLVLLVIPVFGGWTEGEYVERVLDRSLAMRVAEQEVALVRAEETGAGLWPNPSVDWERESTAGASQDNLTLSIPLVLSGRLGLESSASELQVRAGEALVSHTRAKLKRDAILAFSRVIAAKEREATLSTSLEALSRLSAAVEARERAGAAAGYDRLRIDVERATVQSALRTAQTDALTAKSEAGRLLGPQKDSAPAFSGSVFSDRAHPNVETLVDGLETARSDLRAFSLKAEASDALARANGRSWIPDPSVTAGIQLVDAGGGLETGYIAGLSLPLPLFDRRQGDEARAAAERRLYQTEYALVLHEALTRARAIAETVKQKRAQLSRHQTDILARTAELRKIAFAAYEGGSSDLLVLVDAERAAREAELTSIDLGLSVIDAETELLFLSGAFDERSTDS